MRKKNKIEPCPFCGRTPSGTRFMGTGEGPALVCDHCSAAGPASNYPRPIIGRETAADRRAGIRAWNARSDDRGAWRRGVDAAADYVEMFDRRVQHPYLLSDCIRAKFNLPGHRKPLKNPTYLPGSGPRTPLENDALGMLLVWHAVNVLRGRPLRTPQDVKLRRAIIRLLKGQPQSLYKNSKPKRS